MDVFKQFVKDTFDLPCNKIPEIVKSSTKSACVSFYLILRWRQFHALCGKCMCLYGTISFIWVSHAPADSARLVSHYELHECHVLLNHRSFNFLFNSIFDPHQRNIKSTLLALCEGNSPVTCEFPAQRHSNAEKSFHLMTSSCAWPPSDIIHHGNRKMLCRVHVTHSRVQWSFLRLKDRSALRLKNLNQTPIAFTNDCCIVKYDCRASF